MQTPFISVIIPLYNKADTVVRTLDSIAAQSFRGFEVVVVDDGSVDDGARVVMEYARRSNVQMRLVSQLNQGVSSARNRGAEEAAGKYIALIDADDEWHVDFLSEISRMVQAYPGRAVYATGFVTSRNKGKLGSGVSESWEVDLFNVWYPHMPLHTSTVVIDRRDFLTVGGFDRAHRYYEDAELLFKLAEKHLFVLNARKLGCYNDDAGERATVASTDKKLPDIWQYPHWQFLDACLAQGDATASMKVLARREIIRYLRNFSFRFNYEYNRLIVDGLPHMAMAVSKTRIRLHTTRSLRYCAFISSAVVKVVNKLMECCS